MNILLNLVLFQFGWIATVAGAGQGLWWPGPISLMVLAAVTFKLSPWPRTDLALMCIACLIGLVVDSAYIYFDLVRFAEPVPFMQMAPIWILGMWMSFALTLNHSMGLFKNHLGAATLFGLFGGPIAYYVDAKNFGAAEIIGTPWLTYTVIGVIWAIMTPLLLALAKNWLPKFDPPVVSH